MNLKSKIVWLSNLNIDNDFDIEPENSLSYFLAPPPKYSSPGWPQREATGTAPHARFSCVCKMLGHILDSKGPCCVCCCLSKLKVSQAHGFKENMKIWGGKSKRHAVSALYLWLYVYDSMTTRETLKCSSIAAFQFSLSCFARWLKMDLFTLPSKARSCHVDHCLVRRFAPFLGWKKDRTCH